MRVSNEVARRFLLGRQGLWPGRRWQGLRGTEHAMRTMEHVQLDPLQVIARAHDLALASRVLDYAQDDWQVLTYQRRRFFEWGGWLAIRPMNELPYWRVIMRREADAAWVRAVLEEHGAVVDEMRAELRRRSGVGNRDFAISERTRVDSYRGRKDSARVLYYLWRIGEAMILRRERFERVYARAERIAPARLLAERPTDAATDDFVLRKMVAAQGISRLTGVSAALARPMSPAEIKAWRERQLADGQLIEVEVEGFAGRPHVALASDRSGLEALAAGRLPRGWKALGPTTTDEATFLSPLDPVVHDRDRTRALFDFDYKWEVYDKVEKRRFGYYVLPILWGDRLVGRFDARIERASMRLQVLGFWLEEEATGRDAAFLEALRRGMTRFLGFLRATGVDAPPVADRAIRAALGDRAERG
ncbi:MAG: crosslink repair DNA glycosylase YcaQ family protein [Candidatus Limnocylindrales bacterium]